MVQCACSMYVCIYIYGTNDERHEVFDDRIGTRWWSPFTNVMYWARKRTNSWWVFHSMQKNINSGIQRQIYKRHTHIKWGLLNIPRPLQTILTSYLMGFVQLLQNGCQMIVHPTNNYVSIFHDFWMCSFPQPIHVTL